MVGLFQTDGSHYGSTTAKGRLSIEISSRDAVVLTELQRHIPCHSFIGTRTRNTSFRDAHSSSFLHIYSQEARQDFERFGVPVGRKSDIVSSPTGAFSRPDYLRGIIDGDGSVGFTAKGYPFISVVTASPKLAQHICNEIESVCRATRTAHPNKRDGVFNIMVTSGSAKLLAKWCYPPGCLSIPRKRDAARAIVCWTAPSSRFGCARKAWTPADDAVLLNLSNIEAAAALERTLKSVSVRRWRLQQEWAGRPNL